MRGFGKILAASFLVSSAMLASGGAQAKKFEVLASFGGHKLGSNPQGPVLIDKDGNIFGTAAQFGPQGGGTVFELKRVRHGYKASSIFRFNKVDGTNPTGALILDAQGNLYGTAGNVAFELSPVAGQRRWAEKILYYFCSQQNCTDGNGPVGGLTYQGASSGALYDGVSSLYGVTAGGGANNNSGAAFELTNNSGSWSESVLYSFCSQGRGKCTDGKEPLSGLLMDASGNLFGTAYEGGNNIQAGTAFELSPNGDSWGYTVLYTFCSTTECTDGGGPDGPLIFDATGNLVGTTGSGGASCRRPKSQGCGTVFKLAPNGADSQETVLHSFCQERDCKDGAGPIGGVVMDALGNLYGATAVGGGNDTDQHGVGGGTVFKLEGAALKILHRFCSLENCADGELPDAGIVLDQAGDVYGATEYGGTYGDGTAFRIESVQ